MDVKGRNAVGYLLQLSMVLHFLVEFLLLTGTNRLCGFPPNWKRCGFAAAVSAACAAVCAQLDRSFWYYLCLALTAAAAFGFGKSGLRRSMVFLLLTLALTGATAGIGKSNPMALFAAGVLIWLLVSLGVPGGVGRRCFVPVRLSHKGKTVQMLALRDTGNTLRDPVSGEPVLVVGDAPAAALTGLTRAQLAAPVETVASAVLPGLRLLPFRAVGKQRGLLLALRLDSVHIDGRPAATLVAFAPEGLDNDGIYQALAGGMA